PSLATLFPYTTLFRSTKLDEDISSIETYLWDFFNIKDVTLDLTKKASRYFEYIKLTSYFDHLKTGNEEFIWLASFENKEWGISLDRKSTRLNSSHVKI